MGGRKLGRAVVVFCAVALAPGPSGAWGAGWVGKVVVRTPTAQRPRARIGHDGDTADQQQLVFRTMDILFATFRVVRERSPWLYVVAEGGECRGWLMTSEVMTLNRAIEFHGEVVGRHPTNWLSYSLRGIYYARRGESDRALADLDEAIRLKPGEWGLRVNRGLIQYARHEYEGALKDLDQVVDHMPKSAEAYTMRGHVRLPLGQIDEALADLDEAIRLRPEWSLPRCFRSEVWCAKGEYLKALADADEAIRLDDDNARGHAHRAWILAMCPDDSTRDGKRALESAKSACKLTNWHDAFSLGALAAASAEVGDFQAAVRWQKKAMAEVPPADELAHGDGGGLLKLYDAHKPFRHALMGRTKN